eukprot:CAMPEP_0185771380 /NCGR_PEP_ID=MMETSP1174-20130828/64270_1 /TAXON_ID=35687 /ORGANISM="Dictyocha speculum, Strain CCMP1381" /LENGTH=233 /DNA_ID=CAMNT_0028457241 /DNA_START=204 /DNA_END=905 /DNA_ORIENTATION=-
MKAANMGRHAARVMVQGETQVAPYDSGVEHLTSRFMDLTWHFFGSIEGNHEVVILDQEEDDKDTNHICFLVLWVTRREDDQSDGGSTVGRTPRGDDLRDELSRVQAVLLQGGTPEQVSVLAKIAEEQPIVVSVRKLKKLSMSHFLADPHCLEPAPLGVGEFYAEDDFDGISDVFHSFCDTNSHGQVKVAHLGAIMKELGANWDEDELAEAQQALDLQANGMVGFESFRNWWLN